MPSAVRDGRAFHSEKLLGRQGNRWGATLGAVTLAFVGGCEPKLVVGEWSCGAVENGAGGDGSGNELSEDPFVVPWSTSFENGFCEYAAPAGFCYGSRRSSHEVVTSPVRTGNYAAAYSIVADDERDGYQTRCVREGEWPTAAYYSAHFFVPSVPEQAANWNLIHFRSGDGEPLRSLWDVSLSVEEDGTLRVFVFDFLRRTIRESSNVPPVPVGAWFELEVFLRPALDETGAFVVYQDGVVAVELSDLSTTDGRLGQWYVGNLAASLTPPESTIYVDDVAIRGVP